VNSERTHNALQLGWERLDLEPWLNPVGVITVDKRSEWRGLHACDRVAGGDGGG
jgi:hypothetical protein